MKKLILLMIIASSTLNAMDPVFVPVSKKYHRFIIRFLESEKTNISNGDLPLDNIKSYLTDPDSETEILLDKNQPVGFVNYSLYDFVLCGIRIREQTGKINMLGVTKENRKKGYGTQILRHALRKIQAHNIDSIYAHVVPQNKPAKHLFVKEGFQLKLMVPQFSFEHYQLDEKKN